MGSLNFLGTIKLEYGVHRDFRGEKYAYPLLKELTEYIINHVNDVKQIRGDINLYNGRSIKVAEKVGYKKVERNDQNFDYRYPENSKTK